MVKAKSSYTQQLILNDWYDFPDPGVYEINVRLKSSRQPESECLNATFAIEIVPLDKQQLRQSCEELVEVVRENVQNFENASDAAKALLIIKHPVAVPCLEGALKANHAVSSFVIAGLEEIGNEEAVQVLISLLGNPNPDDSDFVQARAALFAIEKKTTDPATLELIKKALSRAEARAAKSN